MYVFAIHFIRAKTNCDLFMLSKEDLKHCLRHYPHVAEHIITVAKERYNLVKRHEISAVLPNSPAADHSTQPNQLKHDDQERSKQSCLNRWFIINPENYVGLTLSAIGHIFTLLTSLILPYQVNFYYVYLVKQYNINILQATFVDTTTGLYVVTYLAEVYFIIEVSHS